MSTRSRRAVPFFVLALLAIFVLPYRNVARADVAGVGGELATNPLILTNSVTGAQVQMMPTTAWVAQHKNPGSSGGGSTGSGSTSVPGALPSPTCTLGTDDSPGDAHVLVNTADTQYDSLDITAFGVSSDATNISGQMSVQSLSNGTPVSGTPAPATPQIAGGGDVWYVVWNYGSAPGVKGYFLETMYPGSPSRPGYVNDASTSNLPVNLSWGTIVTSATGGDQFTSGGPASGSFDTANNRITVTAPMASLGSPPAGAVLSTPYGEGDALVGTAPTGGLLETADKLTSSYSEYHVGNSGTTCPAPQSATNSAGVPTSGSSNNLSYFGGPIVQFVHNHLIWWLPKAGTLSYSDGRACTEPGTTTYSYEQPDSGTATLGALPGGPDGDTDYKSIISQYFSDLGGTSFYNLLTQYADLEVGSTVNAQHNNRSGSRWHPGGADVPNRHPGRGPAGDPGQSLAVRPGK